MSSATSNSREPVGIRVVAASACVMLALLGLWFTLTILGWEVSRADAGYRTLAGAFLHRRATAVTVSAVAAGLWLVSGCWLLLRQPAARYLMVLASTTSIAVVFLVARI